MMKDHRVMACLTLFDKQGKVYSFWLIKGVVILLLFGAGILKAQNGSPSPNILFILVDDLGWSDLGYMGSHAYETPHVDQLASEGMMFTDFYAGGPVCSPTRASIMTGKSTARTGITTYLITPEQDAGYVTHQLELSEFTIAEAFEKHGYATGLFGKWHLGYEVKHWAENQGFQTAVGGTTSKNAWQLAYPDKVPPVDQLEVRYFSPHHLTHMQDGPGGEYLTERLTDETMQFIEDHQEEPFFAFLSFHTVHTPLEAKPAVIEKYKKEFEAQGKLGIDEQEAGSRKYQNLPAYAAMVQHMDENVGRLLDKIEELGLSENTIVVFTSDNGGKHSVTSNAPLRGAKHNLYEGGIRVSTIIRWPGKIKAGTESSTPLISDDFYPTLLDVAGLPLVPEQHLDGMSFKKILMGEAEKIDKEALYWHYPHGVFQGAVRWGDYKLIYHYQSGEAALYNLANDPGESNDISSTEGRKTQKMTKMLKKWLKKTQARFPEEGIILP